LDGIGERAVEANSPFQLYSRLTSRITATHRFAAN